MQTSRRRVLAWAAALGGALPPLRAQGTAGALRVGTSCAQTGPLGEIGREATAGIGAAFAQVNLRGGVHAQRLELLVLEDAYDPARTEANVRRLIEAEQAVALLGVMGTPNNERVRAYIAESRIAHVAPLTGASSLRRETDTTVFHLRASYADEARYIAGHLLTVGLGKVALIRQDNSFGQDVEAGLLAALAPAGVGFTHVAKVGNTDDGTAEQAARAALASGAKALVLGTAGAPTLRVLRAVPWRTSGVGVYALSVMGARGSVAMLGEAGRGVVVSQVMPAPWGVTIAAVRDFQQAMRTSGSADFTYFGLEGYLAARLLVEGLRRAGPKPTRQAVAGALASMKAFEIGGLHMGFGSAPYVAQRHVELTMIRDDGSYLR